MKVFFFGLSISFLALLVVNISWIIVNIYMFIISGVESIVTGQTLAENVYYSMLKKEKMAVPYFFCYLKHIN